MPATSLVVTYDRTVPRCAQYYGLEQLLAATPTEWAQIGHLANDASRGDSHGGGGSVQSRYTHISLDQ